MTSAQEEKLEQLMQSEKWDEARELFRKLLETATGEEEVGRLFLRFGASQMAAKTRINDVFLKDMREGLEALQLLNNVESQLNDRVAVAKVKDKIQDMEDPKN